MRARPWSTDPALDRLHELLAEIKDIVREAERVNSWSQLHNLRDYERAMRDFVAWLRQHFI